MTGWQWKKKWVGMCGPSTVPVVIYRSVFDSHHLQFLNPFLLALPPSSLPNLPIVYLMLRHLHLHRSSQLITLNISSDYVGYSTSWKCWLFFLLQQGQCPALFLRLLSSIIKRVKRNNLLRLQMSFNKGQLRIKSQKYKKKKQLQIQEEQIIIRWEVQTCIASEST